MDGKIILFKEDNLTEFKYNIDTDKEPFGYKVIIDTDLDESYDELISNPTDLDRSIQMSIDVNNIMEEDENIRIKQNNFLKICMNNSKLLLKNAAYVKINFNNNEIASYIKNNPILNTKKIIIEGNTKSTINDINELKRIFDKNINNIYFELEENSVLIDFNTYKKTIIEIEKISNQIKQLNMSPIEQIMFTYDIVRDRLYKDETEEDKKNISRDLSSSLLGNKIVCLGYSRIFSCILDRLGIEVRECILNNTFNERGHARNEIYVVDKKYGIDGVYYFDTTFDRKKIDNDYSFLLSYKYFAKTKREIQQLDKGLLEDMQFKHYSLNMSQEFEKMYLEKGIDGLSKEMISSINHMSKVVNGKFLLNFMIMSSDTILSNVLDDIKNEIDQLVHKYDRAINAETYINILYNVRKKQYYLNPDKYQFSIDDFFNITRNSNWVFESEKTDIFINRLRERKKKINKYIYFKDYTYEKNIDKQIEHVKTQIKIYEKRSNN